MKITMDIAQAMRSQSFVDEFRKRFPEVTQAQLLKTDIRWDVFVTSQARSFFLSFGVKDTSHFPEAKALVEFFYDYGKTEAGELVARAYARKKTGLTRRQSQRPDLSVFR